MLPEFFTTAELLDWRSWRPDQPPRLLGVPDAILTISGEEPVLAFLRWRVEAAETTVGFRAHEDRPERMVPSWNAFRYVLLDAIDAAATAYMAFDNPHPPEPQESQDPTPRAKPIYRLDGLSCFRCPACGQISQNEKHFRSDTCPRRLSAPFRIEQHRWGYRVANRNGLRLADLFHAYWALPLAIALTGRRLAAFDGGVHVEEEHQDGAGRPTRSPSHLRVVSVTSRRKAGPG
jgi:hypothetical protein